MKNSPNPNPALGPGRLGLGLRLGAGAGTATAHAPHAPRSTLPTLHAPGGSDLGVRGRSQEQGLDLRCDDGIGVFLVVLELVPDRMFAEGVKMFLVRFPVLGG